ncbi:hypothetical protein KPH14_012690 [Odynerus spinipes]|uniref:Uncharacterized protein n=1 Tax=Odynerus spinipes TaxID=1348599 RepID=A0AAD9VLA3_9HYME|nr:hypothetical protein KPH14_012690 [Odynerus spinipes]
MWRTVRINQDHPDRLEISLTRTPPPSMLHDQANTLAKIRRSIAQVKHREAAETGWATEKAGPFHTPVEATRAERDITFTRKMPVRTIGTQTAPDPAMYRRCVSCLRHKLVWCYHVPSVVHLRRPHAANHCERNKTPTTVVQHSGTPKDASTLREIQNAVALRGKLREEQDRLIRSLPQIPEEDKLPQPILIPRKVTCCTSGKPTPLCPFHAMSWLRNQTPHRRT